MHILLLRRTSLLTLSLLAAAASTTTPSSPRPAAQQSEAVSAASAAPAGGTTFDVTAFGADPTGAEPSDDAFNRAIAAINKRPLGGACALLLPPGRYLVLKPLTALNGISDIAVIGHGAHVVFTCKTEYATLLSFKGISYASVALAGDVVQGSDRIDLTGPALSQQGASDSLLLRLNSSARYFHTTKDSTRNNKKGELLTFAATAADGKRGFIEGKGPVFSYAANATTATVISPARNLQVLGLAVTGAGATYKTQAFNFDGTESVRVSGCTLDALNVGIGLASSHQILVSGNSFSRIDMVGLGYSVMIGTFVLSVEVSGNTGSKGRHFVTTGGEDGIARGITISGNRFAGSIEGAISPHSQGYDVAILSNHISDSNIGVESRCPNTVISGNVIVNSGQPNTSTVTAPRSMQCAIYATELGGTNLIIKDNVVTYDAARYRGLINGEPIYGTSIDVSSLVSDDGHVEFDNEYVVISGNTISPIGPGGGAGISVGFNRDGSGSLIDPASAASPLALRIEGNSILSPTRYGQILATGSQLRTRASIKSNTLDAAGASALTATSLRSLSVQGNSLQASPGAPGGVPLMAFANTTSLRVAGNELIIAEEQEEASCVVASLSNVSSHAVQAWGRGCPSGVTIPTPPAAAGGGAVEVTVWADGCFAKALVAGRSVHAIAGDAAGVIVLVGGAGNVSLTCSGAATLSFNAVPV